MDEQPLADRDCEVCGDALRIGSCTSRRTSVRCTGCPAGGDILANGKECGPALEGAIGVQLSVLRSRADNLDAPAIHDTHRTAGWYA